MSRIGHLNFNNNKNIYILLNESRMNKTNKKEEELIEDFRFLLEEIDKFKLTNKTV